MRRRILLRRSAALGAIALAGCMSSGDGGGPGTPTDDGSTDDGDGGGSPTDSPTDSGTGTPPPIAVGETSIETTNTGCAGTDVPKASVSFDADALTVSVDGVLRAADPCHVATLSEATYDDGSTVLEVVVTAEVDDSEEMCAQCVGAIEYTADVTLDGDLPGTVTVVHGTGEDATEVVSVSYDDR